MQFLRAHSLAFLLPYVYVYSIIYLNVVLLNRALNDVSFFCRLRSSFRETYQTIVLQADGRASR